MERVKMFDYVDELEPYLEKNKFDEKFPDTDVLNDVIHYHDNDTAERIDLEDFKEIMDDGGWDEETVAAMQMVYDFFVKKNKCKKDEVVYLWISY